MAFPRANIQRRWLPLLVVAALFGGVLLAVIIATAWPVPGDEHAYWNAAGRLVAGQALYDPAAPANTPYAYWYPPILAQVIAPLTFVLSSEAFTILWTILLMACLWLLGGRNTLVLLACVAFLPVALELRVRNVHLVIALLTVLALRRSPLFWIPAAAVKIAPGLGVLYLLGAGRRREAALTVLVGGSIALASYLLSPDAWRAFFEVALGRAGSDAGGYLAVPYAIRLVLGAGLAVAAGRRGGRPGEIWMVVAITLANPTLWANALSLLVAIVPLARFPVDASPAPSSAGSSHPQGAISGA